MGNKVQKVDEAAQERLTIDELRARYHIKRSTFAGACTANGWRSGKAMGASDFLSAIAAYEGSPMNQSNKKEREGNT